MLHIFTWFDKKCFRLRTVKLLGRFNKTRLDCFHKSLRLALYLNITALVPLINTISNTTLHFFSPLPLIKVVSTSSQPYSSQLKMNHSSLHWVLITSVCLTTTENININWGDDDKTLSNGLEEKIISSLLLEGDINDLFPHHSVYIQEATRRLFIPMTLWCEMCFCALSVFSKSLITIFSPLQRSMWRVTLAAPQRPSSRRTLASISCSVKRATPAALSPASRPASRLWRARGRSSALKPTKKTPKLGSPSSLGLPFPPLRRAEAGVGRPLDSLKGLSESNCGRVWLLFSCVLAQPSREWESKADRWGFRHCKQMMCTTCCWMHLICCLADEPSTS